MKYSIIVPVYNVEKYLKKCIDSILNQSYKEFELIIVNDGSTDESEKIIDKFNDNRIKVIKQSNQGLSVARNNGLKKAKNDYILFVDSDDFIDENLLLELNKNVTNAPDLVRFQIKTVDENYNILGEFNEDSFNNLNGVEAFSKIVKYKFIENAWCYLYKRKYLIENNYFFKEGTYHEDFGLIPLVILNAKVVNSINFIGYNYVQRPNSIMSQNNYLKEVKKANDVLNHYEFLIKKGQNKSKLYNSYIANSTILKAKSLKGKDFKKYKDKLNELKIYDNIISKTFKQKIKKILYKTNLSLALRVIK